ncbi:MAG: OST-HTH/LOTUS domain-containing protein [Chloroflexi bacterium]|nr:OST-HTH/LOTUS domain-containing protein [Chloroflexota bacterium]
MSWENVDYLTRALRIWLREFRKLVRTRLEAEFEEDWYPTEIRKALSDTPLRRELEKAIDRAPSRRVEESFDPSHIRQILIARNTRDLFADLFPHRDLLEARLQYVMVVRNTQVAHPHDSELTNEELDEFVGPMIVLLKQADCVGAVEEIEGMQHEAKVSQKAPVATAKVPDESGQSGAEHDDSEPEWIGWAGAALASTRDATGWGRVEEVERALLDEHPDFRDVVEDAPDGFLDLLRRRPDIFEVTRPSRARREGRPYVRSAADRPVPKDELPDWTPVLVKVVERARESRGRLASRVLPKIKNLVDGFDYREYGHSTFPDLIATRPDLFRLTHRGRGKAFITLRRSGDTS